MSQVLDAVRADSSARYRIGWNSLAERYMIADEAMGGEWCALPDQCGYLKQLSFRNAKGAREWLEACQKIWAET
jgi:hypothetical protein